MTYGTVDTRPTGRLTCFSTKAIDMKGFTNVWQSNDPV
jgi:hypothetical protein